MTRIDRIKAQEEKVAAAARIEPFIEPPRFMEIFCRGTYRELLAGIPVHVITNPHTALQGAASFAIQAMHYKPVPASPSGHN